MMEEIHSGKQADIDYGESFKYVTCEGAGCSHRIPLQSKLCIKCGHIQEKEARRVENVDMHSKLRVRPLGRVCCLTEPIKSVADIDRMEE